MPRRSNADILVDLVPKDGTFIGNKSLQNQLSNWPEDRYWEVRDSLLDAGRLERGRGKGGSVRIPVENPPLTSGQLPRTTEDQLYDPLLKVLQNEWVREMRIEPSHIHFESTARLGKKDTRGTWTRPDITAVSVRTFPHLPGKYFDVWTFEIKPFDALDVTAVFEAASHGGRATRSYALLQVSDRPYDPDIIDRCIREAGRLRVGLIIFSSPSDFSTWETKVEAPRLETAPEALNEFVGYLSDSAKKRLAMWK